MARPAWSVEVSAYEALGRAYDEARAAGKVSGHSALHRAAMADALRAAGLPVPEAPESAHTTTATRARLRQRADARPDPWRHANESDDAVIRRLVIDAQPPYPLPKVARLLGVTKQAVSARAASIRLSDARTSMDGE